MSLTDQFDEQYAELVALRASEAELTDGPDAALKVLGPLTDPIRIRAALGILLRADRHDEAADFVCDKRADEKWIHLAVAAFAFLGDISRARSLLDQADDSCNLSVMRSSRLAFAEGVIDAWRKRRPNDSLLDSTTWPDADVELAKTVIEILDPLLSSVRANRKISGEYELGAVTYAIQCAWIARDREFLSRYIHWLVKYVPVPLTIAELCLRGLAEATPKGLPNRMRVEHPGDFQAALLAAIVERDLMENPEAAFDALVELSALATGEDEKESVCIALFETCGRCGAEQIEKAIEVVTGLSPDGSRLLGVLYVMKHLVDHNLAQAKDQLEAIRDEADGVWWQAQAQVCERSGDEAGAEHAWEKASELVPHPDVVRRSIRASIDRRRYHSAIRGLTKLLEQEPDHEEHLRALAWAHAQLGDDAQAALHLRRLVALDSSNRDYRVWLAQALARTAQIEEAIEVLKPVGDAEDAPLEVMLLLSELLSADHRPDDAFRLLEAIAPDYWDDPRFLFSYMQRGYAAGKDRLAQQTFARILELRREGKVPAELLQEGTLEQLLEYGRSFRSRQEALQQALIAGRTTWLFVEETLGNPPAWAWTLHTQELKWLSEEPLTRAALSIYATNGFTVESTPEGKRLKEIVAPPAGTEVVADLSALLTLHKLGLLQRVVEYFGRVVLPASYGPLQVRDTDRFAQHQPSREQELLTIRECVERRRIRVESQWPKGVIELDEYSDDQETHAYRLQDLLPLLRTTQKAAPAAIAEFAKIAHKASTVDASHPGLQLGDTVLISLMTLRQIAGQPVFEQVIDAMSLCIRATEYENLPSELRAHEAARAARKLHSDLWQTIAELAEHGKISWAPLPKSASPIEDPDGDAGIDDDVSLDAMYLAQHLKCPLVVDDRVLQTLLSCDETIGPLLACGSDSVVHAMQRSGAYDASSAAQSFRQLMNWRYRFLVPSVDTLFAWAEESAENLPGPALLDAAFYLHDSLRDPGLHCGPEQSEPPMPLAVKYVVAWITSVVSFLAKVWSDGKFSEEACAALTRWVGDDLIASCPRGLWYHEAGHNIARAGRFSVFSMAVVQFTGISDRSRANRALRALAESLGLSHDQYLEAVADAIHASMNKDDELRDAREDEKVFSRIMMQNALFHVAGGHLDARAFSRFRELGLFADVAPPPLPGNLAEMLKEATQSPKAEGGQGRLLFITEDKSISVIDVDSILLHPEAVLRRAASDYLRAAGNSKDPWLTPRTQDVLANASDDIVIEDERRWRSAAINVTTTVRNDLLGLLASLRQSLGCNYQHGINQYLSDVMLPRFETLAHFRPPVWHPSEQRQEITSWIGDFAKLRVLDDALTGYLVRCGYVPLSHELSASQLVKAWMAANPDGTVSWAAVWDWAVRQGTPIARYHAITVALHIPQARPVDEWEQFWTELVSILSVPESVENSGPSGARWQLYCELASHFAHHLEALHPAQRGESVACYAWWLAGKVGEILGPSEKNAHWSLREVVLPQAPASYCRWTIARSPVIPSPIRYATLHLRSLWAMSLLTNLALAARSLPQPPGIAHELQKRIADVLGGYLMTSHLAHVWDTAEVPFALQENDALEDLCTLEGYIPNDVRAQLAGLVAFRKELSSPDNLASYLDRFVELPPYMQHLLALALKDIVHSTTMHDRALTKWLEQTNDVVELLKQGAQMVVNPFLDACAELQQHQVISWSVRLPHLLAYAIDELNDPDRIRLLATHLLQMSLNGGTGSAVQRLAASGRWPEWASAVATWRANLQEVASQSEPWVAARVRSMSSTISRLIGPHRRDASREDTRGVENGGSEEDGG